MSLCGSLVVWEVDEEARRGGRGRKLQEPAGRWETRVKISEMRRCWTLVSCSLLVLDAYLES
jgi:hypothetical protein